MHLYSFYLSLQLLILLKAVVVHFGRKLFDIFRAYITRLGLHYYRGFAQWTNEFSLEPFLETRFVEIVPLIALEFINHIPPLEFGHAYNALLQVLIFQASESPLPKYA